ncbi:MAG: hypothetical protein ACN4G0_05415, partial [Polyangiales bacterium]
MTESPAESATGAESVTGTAPESVPDPAPGSEAAAEEAVAETVSGEQAAAEAHADTLAGEAAPDEGTPSSAGDAEAPGGKKKRRRRRKKKGAQAGASEAPGESKAQHHHAPFLHLFSGGVTRKHAFSPGEEIAGRVDRVEHGAIIVDVFGKATAIADVNEPRDIPALPKKVEAPQPKDDTAVAQAADAEAPKATAVEAPIEASAEAPAEAPAGADAGATPVEANAPQAPMTVTSDTADWEFSSTEVEDGDEEDLGEADTVVAALAFDPTSIAEVPTAPPTPVEATVSETEATALMEAPQEPDAPVETPAVTEPREDPAEADLTLLDPLPELEAPQAGAIFRGRIGGVAESGHIVIVNRIIDKGAVRKSIRAARELHHRVQGLVYGYNRGGFDVLVGGVRAFCPASAMSLTPIEDPNT